jgi:hypothetical protein
MMRLWNNLNQACSNSNTGKLNNLRVFGSNKGHKLGGQNLLSPEGIIRLVVSVSQFTWLIHWVDASDYGLLVPRGHHPHINHCFDSDMIYISMFTPKKDRSQSI